MNAQEALNEIIRLFDQMDLPDGYTKFIELKDGFASLQQLVKQSNAKPKTLEELDWIFEKETGGVVVYRQNAFYLTIIKGVYEFKLSWIDRSETEHSALIDMELVKAIQQKMKELGWIDD